MSFSKLTTAKLASSLNFSDTKTLESLLVESGFLEAKNSDFSLTEKAISIGAEQKTGTNKNGKTYSYFLWPKDLAITPSAEDPQLLNASDIASYAQLPSATRVNQLLLELGWIDKWVKGWKITDTGLFHGGKQFEVKSSGIPYVKWPKDILDNRSFQYAVDGFLNKGKGKNNAFSMEGTIALWKPGEFRTVDGHFVRSEQEMMIDNWLYLSGIHHAYERRLPLDDNDFIASFYLPVKSIYIDYFSEPKNEVVKQHQQLKKQAYQDHNLSVIFIEPVHFEDLDNYLAKELLKLGIRVDI